MIRSRPNIVSRSLFGFAPILILLRRPNQFALQQVLQLTQRIWRRVRRLEKSGKARDYRNLDFDPGEIEHVSAGDNAANAGDKKMVDAAPQNREPELDARLVSCGKQSSSSVLYDAPLVWKVVITRQERLTTRRRS
jgi:hypothetical protein